MFSAILGLAGSAFGAMGARRDAAAARAQQDYQFRQQMDLQRLNLGMAQDALNFQREENQYQRSIERMNRRIAEQEREFELGQLRQNREALMDQRRIDIERQIEEDREAAKIQQFNLENLLQRQDIAEEERSFAEQQLEYVKAIATGERDEDMRRFLEERAMAEIERSYMLDQYENAQQQAMAERNEQMARRDEIFENIYGLQSALNETAAGFGLVPEIQQITDADIASEIDRRSAQYQSDVDRAADRVASINEADLIRGGMDESTAGTARRGKIAARIANEYQSARNRAYDDALRYITGESSMLADNVNDIIGRRQAMLSETAGVAGAGIDQMMRVPQATSAADAVRYASLVPTGIYNRNISSANAFRAPVGLGSAQVQGSLGPGIADYRRPTSLGQNVGGVRSAISGPTSALNLGNAGNFLSNAQGIGNNLYNAAVYSADAAMGRSSDASSTFGRSFNRFINDQTSTEGSFFSSLDDKMNNYFAGRGWQATPSEGWPTRSDFF